jgi:hypothetical protein
VLLTTAFSLMLSLRVKTVRAAAHISLFLIVPLLLLVQMFHEVFLQGLLLPAVTLAASVVLCAVSVSFGLRRFVSL